MEVQSAPVLFEAVTRTSRPAPLSPRDGAERRARESSGEDGALTFPELMNTRQQQTQAGVGPKGDQATTSPADGAPEVTEPSIKPEAVKAETVRAETVRAETAMAETVTAETVTAEAVKTEVAMPEAVKVDAAAAAIPVEGTGGMAAAEPAIAGTALVPGSAVLPAAAPVGQAAANPMTEAPSNPEAASPVPAQALPVTGNGGAAVAGNGLATEVPGPAAGKGLAAASGTKAVADSGAEKPAPTASAAALEATAKGRESYLRQPVVTEAQLVAASLKEQAPVNGVPVAARPEGTSAGATTVQAAAETDDGTGQQPDSEHAATVPAPTLAPESEAPLAAGAQQTPGQDVLSAPAGKAAEVTVVQTEAAMPAPASDVPQAAEARSGQAAEGTPANGPDPSIGRSVRQQVARGVGDQFGAAAGGEKLTIRLNPESLGQIDLRFESSKDRLTVVISAGTPEAEAALRENLKDLTDRIIDRSSRYSHVEIRIDTREGADARPDAKQDSKQEGRQDQRRENSRQDGGQGGQSGQSGQDQPGRHAHQARLAWESAMSWQLADQAAGKEG